MVQKTGMESRFKRPRIKGYGRSPSYVALRANRIAAARRLRRRRYAYPSIKQEPKFYDTSYAPTALTSNTTAASLEVDPSATSMISTPAVGDSEQNRDGKKIIITQVEIKGTLHWPSSANQTAQADGHTCWVALVLDTQTNNTQMNSEDCFKFIDTTSALYCRPMRNLLFGGRFRILKMKHFYPPIPSMSYDGTNMEKSGVIRGFKFYKKLRLPVNFNAGTTASIANVQDNSLHVIAWANQSNTVSLSYNARIRFIG